MHATRSTDRGTLLLIETHSPASQHGDECLRVARVLLVAGDSVHLHLIQDGVVWLQQDAGAVGEMTRQFPDLLRVTVDDVSLDLRGIARQRAADSAEVIDAGDLIRAMCAPSVKTIWHS